MTTVIIIAAVTCICLILSVLFKTSVGIKGKSISIYWIIVMIGALVILCSGLISFKEAFEMITADTAINPLKILVLFLSMSVLSIFLDEIGFFRYLAGMVLKRAKTSQKMLMIYLYLIVSVLTVFTSNDIIILTFTPFICYFAKNAKIDPIPYLFAEFVAANTWSMMLVIGNPTNVYLATTNGITFVEYVKVMVLPTIMGGAAAFTMIMLVFRNKLKKAVEAEPENVNLKDRGLLAIGIAHLGICTVFLVISSYINIDMWLITMCFALSLFIWVIAYKLIGKNKERVIGQCLKRIPWQLIPFVLSMFVVVLALDKYQVTDLIAGWFGNKASVWVYGASSFISANFINNIPMSVLFSAIIGKADGAITLQATYAAVVGSNIGAILTPIGALAGIMWSSILKKHGVKFSFLTYIKYGAVISVPALAFTLLGLDIVL